VKNQFLALSFCLGLILSILIACQSSIKTNTLRKVQVSQTNPMTIAIISDLNSQYGSTEYEPEIEQAISLITKQWKPNLVLGGGDAIAGQKQSLTKEQIEAMWQAFDLHIAKPLRDSQIPYAFTIGNHDGSGAIKNNQFVFERERNLASAYWQNPQHNSGIDLIEIELIFLFIIVFNKTIFFI
jgi:predicted MPP superfamily phosphohydrolase